MDKFLSSMDMKFKYFLFVAFLIVFNHDVFASLITSKSLTVIKTNYTSHYTLGFDVSTALSVDRVQIQRLAMDYSLLGSWDLNARTTTNRGWWAWNSGTRPLIGSGTFAGIYRISLFGSSGALIEQSDNAIDDSVELPMHTAPKLNQTSEGYQVALDYSADNSIFKHTLDLWDNTEWNRDYYSSYIIENQLLIHKDNVQVGNSYNLYHGIFNYDTQDDVRISYRSTALTRFTATSFPVPEPSTSVAWISCLLILFVSKFKNYKSNESRF